MWVCNWVKFVKVPSRVVVRHDLFTGIRSEEREFDVRNMVGRFSIPCSLKF